MRNREYVYLWITVKKWLNNETTLGEPYFSVWLKSSNATTLVFYDFYEQRNPGTRGSHVIKLMAKPLLIADISFFSFVLFLSHWVFFSFFFVLFVIFRAASLFLFDSVIENWILNIFLKIIISIRYSGMFQKVPCTWFYRRPSLNRLNCSDILRRPHWYCLSLTAPSFSRYFLKVCLVKPKRGNLEVYIVYICAWFSCCAGTFRNRVRSSSFSCD